MSGFGKHSGPTTAPKSTNPFQFQCPPPSSTAPIGTSRGIEAVDRVHSPASVIKNSSPAMRLYQYGGVQRPSFHPHLQLNPINLPATYPNLPAHQDRSVVSPHVGLSDNRKSIVNEVPDMQAPKQGRLPTPQPADEFTQEHHQFAHNGSKRISSKVRCQVK